MIMERNGLQKRFLSTGEHGDRDQTPYPEKADDLTVEIRINEEAVHRRMPPQQRGEDARNQDDRRVLDDDGPVAPVHPKREVGKTA